MHKLNSVLSYILKQPAAARITQNVGEDNIFWTVLTNFKYEILTDDFAEIYFYVSQFSQHGFNFVESINVYNFWEQCESEKL